MEKQRQYIEWTKDLEAEFKFDYPELSKEELMQKYKADTWRALVSKAHRLGLTRRNYISITKEEEIKVVEEFKSGIPAKKLMEKYNLTMASCYAVLRRNGAQSGKAYWNKEKIDEFIKDNTVMFPSDIMKKYNLTADQYRNRRHTYGLAAVVLK